MAFGTIEGSRGCGLVTFNTLLMEDLGSCELVISAGQVAFATCQGRRFSIFKFMMAVDTIKTISVR
jgi:hypothetical protein